MSGGRDAMWRWIEEHGGLDNPNKPKCPCYKCRFWEPWDEDCQDEFGMRGNCLRFPPMPIGDVEGMAKDWQWPEVGCLATCGEWQKRKASR